MNSSLAILITYYGEQNLLRECLESILAQDNPPDEIIVYDDASVFPAENYIPPNTAVKVIRGEVNKGPGYGRNQLLAFSQSDYVHFQDADDLFMPHWCQRVRSAIATSQADIILTEISSFQEDLLVCEKVLDLDKLTTIGDLVRFSLQGPVLVSCTTFRREIALQIGGYRTRAILPQSEDFDFHIRLAATQATYTVVTEPCIIQRLRANSHSQDTKLCWISALKSISLLSKELPQKYFSDLAEASARVSSILFLLNAYSEAKKGFQLARQLGSPKFLHRKRHYQFIASLLGQETAEWLGVYYRRLFPNFLRQVVGR